MTYDTGNPGPGLGEAQKCCGVKQVIGIQTPFQKGDKRITSLKEVIGGCNQATPENLFQRGLKDV